VDCQVWLFMSLLPIRPSIANDYIYNNISSTFIGVEGYDGHDIEDILPVFSPFYVYKIDPNFTVTSQECFRYTGALMANNPANLVLDFSSDVLEEFVALFLYGPEKLYYDNLLNALLSNSYKHSFIEIYQCIESLYQITYIEGLYTATKPHCSFLEFLEEVENKMSWRPVESKAISKIFSRTPSHVLTQLVDLMKSSSSSNKLPSWFYSIRNNLVHLKYFQNKVTLNDQQWQKLIKGTLHLVTYWFNHYDKVLK